MCADATFDISILSSFFLSDATIRLSSNNVRKLMTYLAFKCNLHVNCNYLHSFWSFREKVMAVSVCIIQNKMCTMTVFARWCVCVFVPILFLYQTKFIFEFIKRYSSCKLDWQCDGLMKRVVNSKSAWKERCI